MLLADAGLDSEERRLHRRFIKVLNSAARPS
jgi:hypothetical protein